MHQLKEKESLGGLGECSQMFLVCFFLESAFAVSLIGECGERQFGLL